ncbi:hypothetical protein GCM10009606_20610 [Nocardioides aquiterrae]|uniref:Uncharacterized protein n=2 Tax=Nocardioides aquiterrae TaxID=203799 RepID=A0ABP4EZR8_9ACTN
MDAHEGLGGTSMRDVLHAVGAAAVIAVAALCTLVQLSDANHAFDRLGHDDRAVIQQVSSDADHQRR